MEISENTPSKVSTENKTSLCFRNSLTLDIKKWALTKLRYTEGKYLKEDN